MPELPEIETIVRDLKSIEGQKVIFNKLINDRVFRTSFYKLDGLVIEKIERYGKYIVIKFEKSALLIHLGMSGQLFLEEGSHLIQEHCHWLIQLEDGWQLRYIDTRRFGKIWHQSYEDCINYIQSKIGPEPWQLEVKSFILRIKQNKYLEKTIKEVLLDQKLIAGIGNIYASEILYEAYIHPKTLVKYLNDKQIENILYCTRRVLEKAIKNKGTTISDFKTGKGDKGNNQSFLKVYKQSICGRDGDKIIKENIANRSTFFCNTCQRLLGE